MSTTSFATSTAPRFLMAMMFAAVSLTATASNAGITGDKISESFTSASNGPVEVKLSATAFDRVCNRLISSNCQAVDCKLALTRCLDIKDITTSVKYTGSRTGFRVKSWTEIKFDGKKILATSRGFTLVNDSTVCKSPDATAPQGTRTVSQSSSGSVCAGPFRFSGVAAPQKVTYTVNWQVSFPDGSNVYGSKSWDQSINYDN